MADSKTSTASANALLARPAETGGVLGTIGTLGCYVFGVRDPQILASVGAVAGALPAAVTFVVSNGGVRGLVSRVWQGR